MVVSANYLVNVLCVNDALKIFKKVVDERLKTMYYIQVAYDRRFFESEGRVHRIVIETLDGC